MAFVNEDPTQLFEQDNKDSLEANMLHFSCQLNNCERFALSILINMSFVLCYQKMFNLKV